MRCQATSLPDGWSSLTAEYAVKIVARGKGERFAARGRVVRPGRALTAAAAEVFAVENGEESLCATAFVTIRNIERIGTVR